MAIERIARPKAWSRSTRPSTIHPYKKQGCVIANNRVVGQEGQKRRYKWQQECLERQETNEDAQVFARVRHIHNALWLHHPQHHFQMMLRVVESQDVVDVCNAFEPLWRSRVLVFSVVLSSLVVFSTHKEDSHSRGEWVVSVSGKYSNAWQDNRTTKDGEATNKKICENHWI